MICCSGFLHMSDWKVIKTIILEFENQSKNSRSFVFMKCCENCCNKSLWKCQPVILELVCEDFLWRLVCLFHVCLVFFSDHQLRHLIPTKGGKLEKRDSIQPWINFLQRIPDTLIMYSSSCQNKTSMILSFTLSIYEEHQKMTLW